MRALVAIVVIVLIAPFGSASSSSNSSSIMGVDRETSSLSHLDGSGVVIAVADTGIDIEPRETERHEMTKRTAVRRPKYTKTVLLFICIQITVEAF